MHADVFDMLSRSNTDIHNKHQQCARGLVCYQRDAGEPVPSCIGEDDTDTDFCVVAGATLAPSEPPTDVPSLTPTLTPTATPTQNPTVMPTVTPTATPTQSPTVTPTVTPTQITSAPTETPIRDDVLQIIGNDGNFATFPLQKCMGDCDANLDVSTGLAVFHQCSSKFLSIKFA